MLLVHLLAPAAGAQLRGTVADPAGRPVTGVAVELWSPLRQLGVQVSGADGGFRFPAAEAREASGIMARRVGWATAHVRVVPGDTLVTVRVEPQAETLEGLTVTARRATCPNREDPRARALWTALRDRYDGGRDTSAIAAHAVQVESVGPKDRIGFVDTTRATRSWRKTHLPLRRMWAHFVSTRGYAVELTESMGEAYAAWQYAPLESHYATHFVEDLFGEQHTLSLVRQGGEQVVLGFCPRRRQGRNPRIEGTLTLGSDGALLQAAWKYLTPGPREDAGAEVDFAPAAISAAVPLLLPATTLYWRRTTRGRYYQRWEKFEEWRVVDRFAMPEWGDRPDR